MKVDACEKEVFAISLMSYFQVGNTFTQKKLRISRSVLFVAFCHSLDKQVGLSQTDACCVREAGEKMDAMFGLGTSLAHQDTRTVTLASWAMWQLAVTVCCNDLNPCTLGRVKLLGLESSSSDVGRGCSGGLWVRGTDASWNCGRGTSSSPALRQQTLQLHYCHKEVHSDQTLAHHPLWLPAVCSVSQPQQLNSFYLRHFSRHKRGNFFFRLIWPHICIWVWMHNC